MGYKIVLALVLMLGLIYYFRQARAAPRNRNRIVDLLVIGLVLLASPKLSAYIEASFSSEPAGIDDPFEIAGILLFAYGWGILIVEKFWEGLKGSNRDSTPPN